MHDLTIKLLSSSRRIDRCSVSMQSQNRERRRHAAVDRRQWQLIVALQDLKKHGVAWRSTQRRSSSNFPTCSGNAQLLGNFLLSKSGVYMAVEFLRMVHICCRFSGDCLRTLIQCPTLFMWRICEFPPCIISCWRPMTPGFGRSCVWQCRCNASLKIRLLLLWDTICRHM